MKLAAEIFTTYIITAVIVNGHALASFRTWFVKTFPWLTMGGKNLIDCRLCVGFYVAIPIGWLYNDIQNILLIYGASYWLCTQER